MRKGWRLATVGEVCEIVNGGTPKTNVPDYWDGDHRWITPAEMGKRPNPYVDETARKLTDLGLANSSARLLPPHSVILSSRAPIGHLVINTKAMATNQGCKGLVPKELLDHKFLFFYLTSIVDHLNELGTGTTFKELSGGKLKEVRLPLPSLPEQKRIIAILEEAFEGIDRAIANTEKNLANAREVFESYLNSVFRGDADQVPLSDLASEITDGDHSPPPKAASGIPFITISNIVKSTLQIDFTDTFFVPNEYFHRLKANKKPKIGDVLYTVTGATLGIPVLVRDSTDFCFQRHIGLIRPKPSTDSAWLSYALLSKHAFNQATVGSTGAAQKTVSLSILRNIKLPRMPTAEQCAVARKLDALSALARKLEAIHQHKLAALEELKQAILQKAFAGDLTARSVEALQEAAQ